MARGSLSVVSGFLLLGLSQVPGHQPLLSLFLSVYLVAVVGNLPVSVATSDATPRHHTHLTFFIATQLCINLCFASTAVSRMLVQALVKVCASDTQQP